MKNNINIAELLKDCPKGTKLYSTIFGEVELKEVKDNGRSVCIFVTNFYGQEEMFYPDGKYNTHYSDSECTLFPSKEQRDWSKFCPFKDGDVLSGKNGSVFIFNSRKFIKCLNNYAYTSHCLFVPLAPLYVNPGGYRHTEKAVYFATEEEKQKLFKAIKDNGFRWNDETKTLEKLIEPKFKEGDIVVNASNEDSNAFIYAGEGDDYYNSYVGLTTGTTPELLTDKSLAWVSKKSGIRLATEEEKQILFQAIKDNGYRWNADTKTLDKLIKPKFNRGDIVYTKSGSIAIIGGNANRYFYPICRLFSGKLYTDFVLAESERFATEEEKEKLFEAIKENGYKWNAETKTLDMETNKFDITTLKPFDKVLVRDVNSDLWMAAHFSHYTKDAEGDYPYFASASCFKQCVPYEHNEHLLGTKNDCDEYYKTWKDETDE